jgi:transcriptional regulator with XRE-family HTH domain
MLTFGKENDYKMTMVKNNWIYKEFGRRLRNLRQASNLTQDALAERIGLSRTSITNIEKGRQHIPLHVLFSLADVLGIPPVKLLPQKGDISTSSIIEKGLLEKASLGEEGQEWVKRIVASGKEGAHE